MVFRGKKSCEGQGENSHSKDNSVLKEAEHTESSEMDGEINAIIFFCGRIV
jgi:hypothetical protein